MIHKLKIIPVYFYAVSDGRKTFEIRDNRDRGFQSGDIVELHEWEDGKYTGRTITRKITYVTNYEQKDGFVVFSMEQVTRK